MIWYILVKSIGGDYVEQPESGTLQSYFEHIHDDTIKLSWIFEKIEGKEFTDTSIVGNPAAEYEFYSKYIVAIVKDCTTDEYCDIVLAIYGFMDGYDELSIGQRRDKYCQNVGKYDKKNKKDLPLAECWDSIKGNMYPKEKRAIKYLVKELSRKTEEADKPKSYINSAYELIGKPYPIPNYLSGKGYRKCKIEEKVFYVPLTKSELRSLANKAIKETTTIPMKIEANNFAENWTNDLISQTNLDEELENSPKNSINKIEENSETSENAASKSKTEDVLVEKNRNKDGIANVSSENRLMSIMIFVLILALGVVCIILALTVYNHSNSSRAREASIKGYEALEVDSIEILNKNIRLAPGEDAYLEIEIEPDNIQRDDLEYTSSNRAVVTTEKYHIIAHEGWQEDVEHDITITVQGGLMAEDKAHIIITNPNNDVMQGSKGEGGYID